DPGLGASVLGIPPEVLRVGPRPPRVGAPAEPSGVRAGPGTVHRRPGHGRAASRGAGPRPSRRRTGHPAVPFAGIREHGPRLGSPDKNGEGASASELLASVREAFDLVASPFAPYQRDLAEAERDPLGRASSLAARDVRGVSGMDGAAERMAGLAPRDVPAGRG
ncbi:hypothetical protein THAOC_22711, partial [Thalassiosira oceanica]